MKNCDVRMALSVLYYLILVDGQSQEHELQLFEQLGEQFDAAEFKACRETVIADCEKQGAGAADDFEHYELVAEGVDKTLARKPSGKGPQIPLSMVLWDMLAVAHADRACSAEEERLIKHVVRVNNVDQRLYRQFVYTMNACVAVGVQLEAVKNAILTNADLTADPATAGHAAWAKELVGRHPELTAANAMDIIHAEVGAVFAQVLCDAGVFKRDENGTSAFRRFIDSIR